MIVVTLKCLQGPFIDSILLITVSQKDFIIQCVPEKRLPFDIKQQCRAFEFECFNSLMSPKLHNSLLHRDF